MYRPMLGKLENWEDYTSKFRETKNKDLFNQMLQSAYKYSSSIEAKGENYATQSLLMSLIFEQHKN